MKKELLIKDLVGETRLWGRESGRRVRALIEGELDNISRESVLILDFSGIEVMDVSFASEVVSKLLLLAPNLEDKFVQLRNLSSVSRENLIPALKQIDAIAVELSPKKQLIGNSSPLDIESFDTILGFKQPVSASQLSTKLGIRITAVNERVGKLVRKGVVRRTRSTSEAGRDQYLYSVP
jgi:hypothetical protein